MWKRKENGTIPDLKWSKLTKGYSRAPNQKSCNLCNLEAIEIMRSDSNNINLKAELGGFCPHQRWHLISYIKSNRDRNIRKVGPDKC